MPDVYLDAILVFTPAATTRLTRGHNRDPRKRDPGLNPGNFCGIYVSGREHRKVEYIAEVGSIVQTRGRDILVEEFIDMLTFISYEARGYIDPWTKYHLISLRNVKEIEPMPLETLKNDFGFNPIQGIMRYSGTERPRVRVL